MCAWLRAVMLPLACSVVVACTDATGPALLGITLTSKAQAPILSVNENGYPVIECAVAFHAVAKGSGKARWDEATFRFFPANDLTTPFDTSVVEASQIRAAWEADWIEAGELQSSHWRLYAGVPFAVQITFAYTRNDGSRDTRTTSFSCGVPATTSSIAPIIDGISIQPSTEIEPGQTLKATYTVRSDVGLWLTGVQVSAPGCDSTFLRPGSLLKAGTHTISMTVPATCQVGELLGVSFFAIDAALQESSAEGAVLRVVDRTPPVVHVGFGKLVGNVPLPLTGDFFSGESFHMLAYLSDNVRVAKLYWETTPGTRDSLDVSTTAATFNIPVPAGLNGPIQLRIWVRDASGNLSTPVVSAPGAVRVHPTIGRPNNVVGLPGEWDEFFIDSDDHMIYVLDRIRTKIAVVSMASTSVLRTMNLGGYVSGADITPSGDTLVFTVVGSSTLFTLDLKTPGATIKTIALPLLDVAIAERPGAVRVMSNNHAIAIVYSAGNNGRKVLDVDLATGVHRFRTDAGQAGVASMNAFERSLDGTTLILEPTRGLFQRYDVETDQFGPLRSLPIAGSLYSRVTMDASGNTLSMGLNIFNASLDLVRTVSDPGGDRSASYPELSADGSILYVANDLERGVVRIRVSDGAILDRTPLYLRPHHMQSTADGAFLVYSQGSVTSSTLGWIDLR